MSRIFRLEDDDGRGIYHSGRCWPIIEKADSTSKSGHPNPREDGMKGWGDDYIFGFKNFHQLLSWFPPQFHQQIDDAGIRLTIYDVDESNVCRGKSQVAFNHHYAERVDSQPLVGYQPS